MYLKKRLPPALEHAMSDLDVAQVMPAGEDLGLMALVDQARDLAQGELAVEESHALIVEPVAHPATVELGATQHEARSRDASRLALAVGQDVEPASDQILEELRAPSAPVEDDRHALVADELADIS
jgi:hypothetical protein